MFKVLSSQALNFLCGKVMYDALVNYADIEKGIVISIPEAWF